VLLIVRLLCDVPINKYTIKYNRLKLFVIRIAAMAENGIATKLAAPA